MVAYFILVVLALQEFGFSPTSAAIPATVISAALGLGAQSIIALFLPAGRIVLFIMSVLSVPACTCASFPDGNRIGCGQQAAIAEHLHAGKLVTSVDAVLLE